MVRLTDRGLLPLQRSVVLTDPKRRMILHAMGGRHIRKLLSWLEGKEWELGKVGKSLYCGFCEKDRRDQVSRFRIAWFE